jgi:Tol biopolymer transport system component
LTVYVSPTTPAALVAASVSLVLALGGVALAGSAAGPRTTRVSVSTTGAEGDRGSDRPALSADGRFAAFSSESRNLVPGDTNRVPDVFVRDLKTLKTERVSIGSEGEQANGASYVPSISSTGRYVTFLSNATNLAPGPDRNGHRDVYIRDRTLHRTIRVSVSSAGRQGTGSFSAFAPVSADGHSVAFVSWSQLAPQDAHTRNPDVFVRNLKTRETELVSAGRGDTAANGYSGEPSISADGRFVAFSSHASNLAAQDRGHGEDVFVRDLKAHKTTLVSVSSGGEHANGRSLSPAISADGRFVAFTSLASNLAAGDTNGLDDVFLRDLKNGTTERISLGTSGGQSVEDQSYSGGPNSVSAHGEFVVFVSGARDLVPGDANGPLLDVFIRDVARHTTSRVSVNTAGEQANGISSAPTISADGRFVGFFSDATNLASPDTNGTSDAFVRGPLER